MKRIGTLVVACLLAAPGLAADFALQLPITLQPGGTNVQQLDVPAAALAASRSPGLADLRVLDAKGEAQPMQRLRTRPDPLRKTVVLPALPILGRPGALKVTGAELRLDEGKGVRVVRIDGDVGPAEVMVLGTLLDTRDVDAPAASLQLDADLPIGQPVLLQIDASDNLRDWQPLAEKMLYRAAATDRPAPVDLGQARLNGRYLRLRWRAEAPLIAPIVVRAATLATETAPPPALHRVPLVGAALVNAHELRLAMPEALAMSAIEIVPPRPGTLLPVTIYGRANREAAWTELGAGTVFRLQIGGSLRESAPLPLRSGPIAEMRIVADSRTAGFAAVPELAALLPPVGIAFIASGLPPYTLAVGQAGAKPAWMSFLADNGVGGPPRYNGYTLPVATVAAAAPAPMSVAPEADFSTRRILLWGLLVAGVIALAAMVWVLRRG